MSFRQLSAFACLLALLIWGFFLVVTFNGDDWEPFWMVVALPVGVLILYLIFLGMVNNNFIVTKVRKGWIKIVLTWGADPEEIKPGFRLIGIPGIHTLHSQKMEFFKTVLKEDGTAVAKPYKDEVNEFKKTEYPYALPFIQEEDKNGLPLSGIVTMHGQMVNYGKGFFEISDWYSTINSLGREKLREVLRLISFDEDVASMATKNGGAVTAATIARVIKEARDTVAQMLWEALTHAEDDGKSVKQKMLDEIGFQLNSIDVVTIDPPEGWRETILAPYKAEKEKQAAKHQAEASAALFDDTNQAFKIWLDAQNAAVKDNQREAVTPKEIEAKQKELRDRALAKTAGYQQIDVRGLERAGTAVIGGGSVSTLVGGQGGGGSGRGKKDTTKDDDDFKKRYKK